MALVHPEARQAVLSALPPAYYEKSFDSVGSAFNALHMCHCAHIYRSVEAEIVVACKVTTCAICAAHWFRCRLPAAATRCTIIVTGRPGDFDASPGPCSLRSKQVRAELAALKGGFNTDRLEEVIESRTSMLEVMLNLSSIPCTT